MLKPTHWLQLRINIASEQLPHWEPVRQSAGALSITYQDSEDNPVLEPGPGEIILWDTLNLTALFAKGRDSTALLSDLAGKIDGFDKQTIQIEYLPDRHWERAWLDDFAPMQFGRRLMGMPVSI